MRTACNRAIHSERMPVGLAVAVILGFSVAAWAILAGVALLVWRAFA